MPKKVFNILDMLLMGFWRKKHLEKPTPIRDLPYVSHLGKSRDAFTHILSLEFAVKDILDCNGPCRSSVNCALIFLPEQTHPSRQTQTNDHG